MLLSNGSSPKRGEQVWYTRVESLTLDAHVDRCSSLRSRRSLLVAAQAHMGAAMSVVVIIAATIVRYALCVSKADLVPSASSPAERVKWERVSRTPRPPSPHTVPSNPKILELDLPQIPPRT
jgi:hypothetical protein